MVLDEWLEAMVEKYKNKNDEKTSAYKYSMVQIQKRIDRLEYLKRSRGILNPSDTLQLQKCYELMEKGRKLLGE